MDGLHLLDLAGLEAAAPEQAHRLSQVPQEPLALDEDSQLVHHRLTRRVLTERTCLGRLRLAHVAILVLLAAPAGAGVIPPDAGEYTISFHA